MGSYDCYLNKVICLCVNKSCNVNKFSREGWRSRKVHNMVNER